MTDLFYFSRRVARDPFKSKWLVAGVVEADDEADARRKLEASGKGAIRASDFDFQNLRTCPRSDAGVLPITIASE